jgi:hypothetical protein
LLTHLLLLLLLVGRVLLTAAKLLLFSLRLNLLHLRPSRGLLLSCCGRFLLLTFDSPLLLHLLMQLLLLCSLIRLIASPSLLALSPQLAQFASRGLVTAIGSVRQRSHLPVALIRVRRNGLISLSRNLRQAVFSPGAHNLSDLTDLQAVFLTIFRYLLDVERLGDITSSW